MSVSFLKAYFSPNFKLLLPGGWNAELLLFRSNLGFNGAVQMKKAILFATLVLMSFTQSRAADSEEGFKTIFDGKTFTGWKMSVENTNTWKIEEGVK